MDVIKEAVTKDFNVWMKEKRNRTFLTATDNNAITKGELRNNVKDFLYDTFSISHSFDVNIEDIALAYSSTDPDR